MIYRQEDRQVLPDHVREAVESAQIRMECPSCGCNPLLPENSNFCSVMARSVGNLGALSIKEGLKLVLALSTGGAGIAVHFVETATGHTVDKTDRRLSELANSCGIVYTDEGTYCPTCAEEAGLNE